MSDMDFLYKCINLEIIENYFFRDAGERQIRNFNLKILNDAV